MTDRLLDYERDWKKFMDELYPDIPETQREAKLSDIIFKSISN